METMSIERLRELRNGSYNVAIRKLEELGHKAPNGRVTTSSSSDSEEISHVKRLVSQFYYGTEAKNELLSACISLGWINP